MHARNWQRFDHFSLALVFVAGIGACESGDKQIGGLDGAGASETNDDGDLGDGDGDGGDSADEMGETGEACTGDGDVMECAEPQGVNVDWNMQLGPDPDLDEVWTCAANVEPSDEGHYVMLTHCSDGQGQPQPDFPLHVIGDGPQPEFADGDQPLTEFRFFDRGTGNIQAYWLILRPVGQERIALLGFKGHELILDDVDLDPLALDLRDLDCAPEAASCDLQPDSGQVYRLGIEVGYGCAQAIVADRTALTDLGLEQGTDTVYDVYVKTATNWVCEPDSGKVLEFVIVGRTP